MALMKKKARSFGVVSAAPYGSAAILPISWAYVKVRVAVLFSVFLENMKFIKLFFERRDNTHFGIDKDLVFICMIVVYLFWLHL